MAKFYGIMLYPKCSYAQYAESSINVSSVAMENGYSSKLCLIVNDQKYIVAHLTRKEPQLILDLQFNQGEHFMFENMGNADLSLVGYQHPPNASMDWEEIVESVESESIYSNSETAEE